MRDGGLDAEIVIEGVGELTWFYKWLQQRGTAVPSFVYRHQIVFQVDLS